MNFDDWTADIPAGIATHASGFTIRIEGNLQDPSDVYPGKFPDGLSFADQSRLLRSGIEFLSRVGGGAARSWQSSSHEDTKTQAIKAREELAKRFADRPDRPQRAVLSFKKNT